MFDSFGGSVQLFFKLLRFCKVGHRNFNCWLDLVFGKRLNEEGVCANGGGFNAETGFGVGAKDNDCSRTEYLNFFSCGNAFHLGHADVEHAKVGCSFLCQSDGLLAITGLTHDFVAQIGENFPQGH